MNGLDGQQIITIDDALRAVGVDTRGLAEALQREMDTEDWQRWTVEARAYWLAHMVRLECGRIAARDREARRAAYEGLGVA